VADSVVERAYGAAIARVVKSGDVVLDLGGAFGRRAVRACRQGAARVYTVQPKSIADVARSVVRDNGCVDRVDVIDDLTPDASWLDAVSVVIAEAPGDLPLHGASLTRDPRRSWPARATTIPRRETLSAAIVSRPDLLARHLAPWESLGRRWDVSVPKRMAQNMWSACTIEQGQLATAPVTWATIDYAQACTPSPTLHGALSWSIESPREAHGIAIWPTVELAEGVTIGNGAGTFVAAFFPWPEPVRLVPGDCAALTLEARPLAKGWESCLWNWTTTVAGVGHPTPGGRMFVQSTFFGSLDLLAIHAGLSGAGSGAEKE
jgi:protein arginine N-methyltransferase 1